MNFADVRRLGFQVISRTNWYIRCQSGFIRKSGKEYIATLTADSEGGRMALNKYGGCQIGPLVEAIVQLSPEVLEDLQAKRISYELPLAPLARLKRYAPKEHRRLQRSIEEHAETEQLRAGGTRLS